MGTGREACCVRASRGPRFHHNDMMSLDFACFAPASHLDLVLSVVNGSMTHAWYHVLILLGPTFLASRRRCKQHLPVKKDPQGSS